MKDPEEEEETYSQAKPLSIPDFLPFGIGKY